MRHPFIQYMEHIQPVFFNAYFVNERIVFGQDFCLKIVFLNTDLTELQIRISGGSEVVFYDFLGILFFQGFL